MYFALAVDKDTHVAMYFALDVFFRSSSHPPKSASEYACTKNPELDGYHKLSEVVRFKYDNIFLTAIM